jgi:hypothetical protein
MDQPNPEHILQVGLGFWASKTLLSAVEMELFTELAKNSEDLETLQRRLGLHPRSAHDFFDALVALKFLERRDGRYYNTPSTDLFLDKRSIRFGATSRRLCTAGYRKTKRRTAVRILSWPFMRTRRD